MKVISLRGVNGSGKSHAVRSLMSELTFEPIYRSLGPFRPEAYSLSGLGEPTYVLGPYLSSPCGGCDAVQPYAKDSETDREVRRIRQRVFEGVLISSTYEQVGELLEQWGEEFQCSY